MKVVVRYYYKITFLMLSYFLERIIDAISNKILMWFSLKNLFKKVAATSKQIQTQKFCV